MKRFSSKVCEQLENYVCTSTSKSRERKVGKVGTVPNATKIGYRFHAVMASIISLRGLVINEYCFGLRLTTRG